MFPNRYLSHVFQVPSA